MTSKEMNAPDENILLRMYISELHEQFSILEHKFERAGGVLKVAMGGVELGALPWASNVENSISNMRFIFDEAKKNIPKERAPQEPQPVPAQHSGAIDEIDEQVLARIYALDKLVEQAQELNMGYDAQTAAAPQPQTAPPSFQSYTVGREVVFGANTYRIEGVHLGAAGQESLIEMRSLTHKPGWTGEWQYHPMLFVPEVILRFALAAAPELPHKAEVGDTAEELKDFDCLIEMFSSHFENFDIPMIGEEEDEDDALFRDWKSSVRARLQYPQQGGVAPEPPTVKLPHIDGLEGALFAAEKYQQADMDGIFVTVSRQALDAVIEAAREYLKRMDSKE